MTGNGGGDGDQWAGGYSVQDAGLLSYASDLANSTRVASDDQPPGVFRRIADSKRWTKGFGRDQNA